MRKRRVTSFILACLAFIMIARAETATAQGQSPFNPAAVGVTVADIIECGEGYTSHESYDVKITLLEVVRGEKAWELIKEASRSNGPSNNGYEYVLARTRFAYSARGVPGDCRHELKGDQFSALSADGKAYKSPSVVPPQPILAGTLRSGDSLEGWVVFSVAQDDSKPLMTFSTSVEGSVEHGGNIWFQLYSATPPTGALQSTTTPVAGTTNGPATKPLAVVIPTLRPGVPKTVEQLQRIKPGEVKALLEGGADIVVIDNQPEAVYKEEHIKGAISFPWKAEIKSPGDLPKSKLLIMYCGCSNEEDSGDVAMQLIKRGYTKIMLLEGGWLKWVELGYPTEKGK